MSFIWRKANGDIRKDSSGVPELVRAWTYRKQLSDCGPLPAWITIVGCDPPACVEYTNTNLDPTGRVYVRQNCGAWGGGTAAAYNYAWPADVPDCSYPDGVTITTEEDCDPLVYLCITAESDPPWNGYDEGFKETSCQWPDCHYYSPLIQTGSIGRGPWGNNCSCQAGSYYNSLSIDCNGNVSYRCGGLNYMSGTGTPIPLDSEDLPIGSSVIPVYLYPIPPGTYYGTLTITVSKC